MTHNGVQNSGKYAITISDLYSYFNVLEEDKVKVDRFGVIVRAQFSGLNNQTIDFLLQVTNPTTNNNELADTQPFQINSLTLTAQFDDYTHVRIYSMSGQLIDQRMHALQYSKTLKPGLYIVRLNDKNYKVKI